MQYKGSHTTYVLVSVVSSIRENVVLVQIFVTSVGGRVTFLRSASRIGREMGEIKPNILQLHQGKEIFIKELLKEQAGLQTVCNL